MCESTTTTTTTPCSFSTLSAPGSNLPFGATSSRGRPISQLKLVVAHRRPYFGSILCVGDCRALSLLSLFILVPIPVMLRIYVCVCMYNYHMYYSIVAAWVYDSIISSGVNRWGRDVHCIVGVLGSVTTRYDSVITRKGEGGRSVVVNGPQRPLASLLRETNYASLTT